MKDIPETIANDPKFAKELAALVQRYTPTEREEYRLSLTLELVTVKNSAVDSIENSRVLASEIVDKRSLMTGNDERIMCDTIQAAQSCLSLYRDSWRD